MPKREMYLNSFPADFVYKRLICEFARYDVCLAGLISLDGELWYCKVVDYEDFDDRYLLYKVEWTPECEEYLADYRTYYEHCFYEGGVRGRYDGRDLTPFNDKWKTEYSINNPIVRNTLLCS